MKDDRLHLGHILEAIERIVLYAHDGEERFRTDVWTQDAIIRQQSEDAGGGEPIHLQAHGCFPRNQWWDAADARTVVKSPGLLSPESVDVPEQASSAIAAVGALYSAVAGSDRARKDPGSTFSVPRRVRRRRGAGTRIAALPAFGT